MERLRCIYKSIADGQKVGYWTIVTNVLLILTTFWLGLHVQDMIATKNANASGTLANIEYVEKVKPRIDSLNINYGGLFLRFYDMATGIDKNGKPIVTSQDTDKMKNYIIAHNDEILSYYDDLVATWAYVYNFDTECPDMIKNYAKVLSLTSVIQEYVGEYTRKMAQNTNLKWDDGWTDLETQIKEMTYQSDYIAHFGWTTDYSYGNAMELIKNLYLKIGISKDDKNLQLNLIVLSWALEVHKWIGDHSTYKPKKDNSIVGFILKTPFGSLLLLIVVGLLLAMGITIFLPKQREKSYSERFLEQLVKGLKSFAAQYTANQKAINKLIDEMDDIKNKMTEMAKENNPPAEGKGDSSTLV